MTVSVKWDADAAITGLPDQGTNSKQYPTTATTGTVTVTDEQNPGRTKTVTFNLPLTGGGEETVTPSKTTVNSAGDAAERTINVAGEGFPVSTAGTVALHPGAPGSGGTAVASVNITTDALGAFTGAALVVPAGQAAGSYHIVVTVGAVVSDATAITVTNTPVAVVTADKTTVDSAGDATARTVTVGGTAFPVSTAGTVALHPGAPGSGGTAVATTNITTDAAGAFTGAALVVPAGQAAGDYHIVVTVGAVVADATALTVTNTPAAALTAVPDEINSTGDETARTMSITGTNFAASTAGTVALHPGAPGSGGTAIVTANATTDVAGAIPATPLIVPAGQLAGTYHLVATFGASTSDNTTIDVTGGAGPLMSTPTNLAAGATTATTIPLTWDAVTTPVPAETYVVRHAPTGTTTWTELAPVATAADTITGLTASTGYDVQVKAEAAAHTDSAWSALITATTTA